MDDAEPSDEVLLDRTRGCLLAGAVGDALGAPVEFWSLADIRARLGPAGVTGFVDEAPTITDDTQMALFTAEGLIRASVRHRARGICHPPSVVHSAYLRWLYTQDGGVGVEPHLSGWLVGERVLHHRRAPGTTCLEALRSGVRGTRDERINDSKGCGGVMRAAPVGLFCADPQQAFDLGCDIAADTHGHPSGFLSAGALAAIVNRLVAGDDLSRAVTVARNLLVAAPGSGETLAAVDAAVALAADGLPTPEALERLGAGWVAEEALALGLCCALAARTPLEGMLAAVNHSGDSDSTGSICGNLLGAARGLTDDVARLADRLDAGSVVDAVARDLWRERVDPPREEHPWGYDVPKWWGERYPGD